MGTMGGQGCDNKGGDDGHPKKKKDFNKKRKGDLKKGIIAKL